jgi:RimJ/RimL family protein N-acetyltransferase
MQPREFKAEHAFQIITKDADSIKFAVEAEASAFAYSIFDGEQCVGCAGIMRTYGRCYYVWAIVGEGLRKHRLYLHKMVLQYLPLWLNNVDYVRVEVMCEADNKRDQHWAESLGFEFESRKVRGGANGGDSLVYAKVKPVETTTEDEAINSWPSLLH